MARLHAAIAIATTFVLVAGMAPLHAQSLADVAREEEARRKQIKRPARVFTNKDLVAVPPPAAPVPSPAPTDAANTSAGNPPPGPTDEKAEGASSTTPGDVSKDKPRDQAYWSGRMGSLLAQLDRDRILADALVTRINGLDNDFSARDEPAQRRIILLDRQKAVDELDRIRKSVQNGEKAVADLQEEARRASVPPGWLR